MAADPTKSPAPESPTTARPLELDDDDVQDASIQADDSSAAKPASAAPSPTLAGDAAAAAPATPADDEAPPPKPPRPLTEQQKKEQTLKEAFPTVDGAVIRAVLTASRGNIESAFHALLEMTDPNAIEREPTPPPPPPRPAAAAAHAGRLSPNSQLRADEEYARRLAEHYESEEGSYEERTSGGYGRQARGGGRGGGGGYGTRGGPHQETGLKPNEMWGDKEHSFLDDDLPVIRENLRKGFVETQTKFNNWFTGIKKKIDEEWIGGEDGEDDDDDAAGRRRPQGPDQVPGASRTSYSRVGPGRPPRRSGDYDADPELLSDDFAGIQLHGETPRPNNPHLFRPPPSSSSPRPSSERKVAFRDAGDATAGDVYGASPKLGAAKADASGARAASPSAGGGSASKSSKWQPLSSVDPTPIADNDPFSLGDSEDEKDGGPASKTASASAEAKTSTSSTSPEDAERLRKAAAEAMADSLVDDKPKA